MIFVASQTDIVSRIPWKERPSVRGGKLAFGLTRGGVKPLLSRPAALRGAGDCIRELTPYPAARFVDRGFTMPQRWWFASNSERKESPLPKKASSKGPRRRRRILSKKKKRRDNDRNKRSVDGRGAYADGAFYGVASWLWHTTTYALNWSPSEIGKGGRGAAEGKGSGRISGAVDASGGASGTIDVVLVFGIAATVATAATLALRYVCIQYAVGKDADSRHVVV